MSDDSDKSFERRAGLTLALLAAVLAVNDLAGGKYGDDEIIGTNEKANTYAWYQSKSIKESLAENHLATLEALLQTGSLTPEGRASIEQKAAETRAEVARYGKEKKEITKGSAGVGPEGQVLEIGGQKGQVKGTDEWTAELTVLSAAGDQFDMATLFLQICLVLGAVSLVLEEQRLKELFYWSMVGLGAAGGVYLGLAMRTVGMF
jgi:hypothetical protein